MTLDKEFKRLMKGKRKHKHNYLKVLLILICSPLLFVSWIYDKWYEYRYRHVKLSDVTTKKFWDKYLVKYYYAFYDDTFWVRTNHSVRIKRISKYYFYYYRYKYQIHNYLRFDYEIEGYIKITDGDEIGFKKIK